MNHTPVLAFAAYSGTGKTTLMERLVAALKAAGLRVAVIKHDGHEFDIDREGKDSWRYTQAGADMSIVSSARKTAVIEQRELSFSQVAAMVHDVDLVLVEGYKNEPLTQIGLCRRACGTGFPAPLARYIALVADFDPGAPHIPHFDFDDIPQLTAFILEYRAAFTHIDSNGNLI